MKDIKQTTENITKDSSKANLNPMEKLDIIGLDQQFVGMQSIRPARSVVPKSIKPDHQKVIGRKF